MIYYIIYHLDYKKNDIVAIKDMYITKEDAFNNVERVAMEYIKEFQGKQQAEICKQDKTPDQLLADTTIKEGMYIRKVNDVITIYEKITFVFTGWLKNSKSLQVNKIGQMSVTEYNFDDAFFKCNCNNEVQMTIEKPLNVTELNIKSLTYNDQELSDSKKKIDDLNMQITTLKTMYDTLFKYNRNNDVQITIEQPSTTKIIRPVYSYFDELKKKIESGMVKLKPVN